MGEGLRRLVVIRKMVILLTSDLALTLAGVEVCDVIAVSLIIHFFPGNQTYSVALGRKRSLANQESSGSSYFRGY